MHLVTHSGGEILKKPPLADYCLLDVRAAETVEVLAWGSPRLSHGINIKFEGGDSATIIFSCTGTFDYPRKPSNDCQRLAALQ